MKSFKLNASLLSLLTIFAVMVVFSSCTKEEVVTSNLIEMPAIENLPITDVVGADELAFEFEDLSELPDGLPAETVKNLEKLFNSSQGETKAACCTIPSFYLANGRLYAYFRVKANRSIYINYRCNGAFLPNATRQFHNYKNYCVGWGFSLIVPSCNGVLEAKGLMGEWFGNCAETCWVSENGNPDC